jgi:hypothetical protein
MAKNTNQKRKNETQEDSPVPVKRRPTIVNDQSYVLGHRVAPVTNPNLV